MGQPSDGGSTPTPLSEFFAIFFRYGRMVADVTTLPGHFLEFQPLGLVHDLGDEDNR